VSDAHPDTKFTNPRNADKVAHFDARACSTCHAEHMAERTSRTGVTLGGDFCGQCHGDIGTERPDHKGFPFATCSQAGCHNFHDNLALTEEYLARHIGEPRLIANRKVLAFATAPEKPARADVPADLEDAAARKAWAASAHARAGVGCAKCHESKERGWQRKPGFASCRECHAVEGTGFDGGKHGMRLAADLLAMTPGLARRPMKSDVATRTLGCGTCHDVHGVDTKKAAVDACLRCHDDAHSRAFPTGPHVAAGVTCATCHLPRATRRDGDHDVVFVEHNQNANLRPVTKMIRTVCASCHGVGYAIDALADTALVSANFDRDPIRHVETLEMVAAREAAKAKKRAEKARLKEESK
jgi:hypothetical protein